jgi:acyl-CoA synthetase (AMP-forming)/AMP-acid ligase II
MKPGGLGVVRAGVQVSIVDNDDRTLPDGETGRIRVKTPTMVMGYLNNEQAGQRNYKDGWFYTGDAGCFVGERQLKLMGRVDDVINLGGFKHSCVEFETIAESIAGIEEACVATAPDQQGIDRLVIIGVLSQAVEKQKILERIRTLFPPIILEGGRVLFTDKLIRNESGKLNRKAMQLSIGQAPAA